MKNVFLLLCNQLKMVVAICSRSENTINTSKKSMKQMFSPSPGVLWGIYCIISLLQYIEVGAFVPRCHSCSTTKKIDNSPRFMSNDDYMNDEGPTTDAKSKTLVFIGGGHAHLQAIKAFNEKSRPDNLQVILIDSQTFASYSGMVPGAFYVF